MRHFTTKSGRTHYDLRIKEPDGKMWESWAVPKGVPKSRGVKVAAIMTHKHSEKNARFEGSIEFGKYGSGNLKLLDEGECLIHIWKPGKQFAFELKGKDFEGFYHMVTTRVVMPRKGKGKGDQYFLFKGNKPKE